MKKAISTPAVLMLVTLVAGRAREQEEAPVVAEVSGGPIMMMPVTTTSDEALQHFKEGQQALDVRRLFDAWAKLLRLRLDQIKDLSSDSSGQGF